MIRAILVERSETGSYTVPGSAEIENWHEVMDSVDEVVFVEELEGWGEWTAAYAVKQYGPQGEVWEGWYFTEE
jgi:hypothetical protein